MWSAAEPCSVYCTTNIGWKGRPLEDGNNYCGLQLVAALQHAHLMPERDDLKSQMVARLEEAQPLEICR
jgi:hypothetical protein